MDPPHPTPSPASIAWHLEMLAGLREQPFTPQDVERAYALIFLPFLAGEHPSDRGALFATGLHDAIDELPSTEERLVASALLLSDQPATARVRRLAAIAALAEPPLSLKGQTERRIEGIQEKAFQSLARLLTSEAFADDFRRRHRRADATQSPRISSNLEWLEYTHLVRDVAESDHRHVYALRFKARRSGIRVIALPFRWPSTRPAEPDLFPTITVHSRSAGHSFVDFRPDSKPTAEDWYVRIFHLGHALGPGEVTKLVYSEHWTCVDIPDRALAFNTGEELGIKLHLRFEFLATTIPKHVRGERWAKTATRPVPMATLDLKSPRQGAFSLRETCEPRSRYAVAWD